MNKPVICAQGIHKVFEIQKGIVRMRVTALSGVDLNVFPGETIGIVGESGSGKSTLARILAVLMKPTNGSVVFSVPLAEIRKNIQIVFQNPYLSLNPRMRIRDLLAEPFLYCQGMSFQAASCEVHQLLDVVELSKDILERFPHELSGGQAQRVAIGRALSVKPCVLICDEPTAHLDVLVSKKIIEMFSRLHADSGVALIFISHNIGLVRCLCDSLVVMKDGVVVEKGNTPGVLSHPQEEYTRSLLAAARRSER